MRCLALAQALLDAGHDVIFAMSNPPNALVSRLRSEGIALARVDRDPSSTATIARDLDATWVVVDGYHFDVSYMRTLAGPWQRLLIDDTGLGASHDAELVLNQNLHAQPALYAGAPGRLLLGPSNVLLRREFRIAPPLDRRFGPVERILVTLGGSDPSNTTPRILDALACAALPAEVTIDCIVGGVNAHGDQIARLVARSPLRLEVSHDVRDMSERMARADLAISSGGATVWELAALGVPTLVGTTAPVEERLAEGLVCHGLFEVLGPLTQIGISELASRIVALASDPERRCRLSQRALTLVDRRGAERVVRAMEEGT
jgi:UDP-2,4-diacetamido-2,4,6-trideoxy-beta-L-altropyranose hydrolase